MTVGFSVVKLSYVTCQDLIGLRVGGNLNFIFYCIELLYISCSSENIFLVLSYINVVTVFN